MNTPRSTPPASLREPPLRVTVTASARPANPTQGEGRASVEADWTDYKHQILRTVRQDFGRLRHCHDNAGRRDTDGRGPTARNGTVGAELLVGSTGAVLSIAILGGTMPLPAVVNCVRSVLKNEPYSSPPRGEVARVQIQVRFRGANLTE